ncbi:Dabb family protein [Micrococcaceae bacterium RIT802]|nr:Dabb family protein [Micrococcaceae bacterium RIT 802]
MIRHIVMFRWKDSFTPEIRDAWTAGLDAMRGNIPGMTGLTHGPDIMGTGNSWDHVIVADFTSREDIAVYNTHPLHEAIKPYSLPNVRDLAYVDFELASPATGSTPKDQS